MELNERINALEGEVGLVKAEIKKVLIDIREHMNNYENPFVNAGQLSKAPAPDTMEIKSGQDEKIAERIPVQQEKIEPEYKPEIEPEKNLVSNPMSTAETDSGRNRMEKSVRAKARINGAENIDIFLLTQLMKWTDNSLSNIGKEKLNEILDLYDLTGRIPKETKDIIFKIEDISTINSGQNKEKIEMKDCILAIYQLDRIVTGEAGAQAPLLVSEEELAKWLKV